MKISGSENIAGQKEGEIETPPSSISSLESRFSAILDADSASSKEAEKHKERESRKQRRDDEKERRDEMNQASQRMLMLQKERMDASKDTAKDQVALPSHLSPLVDRIADIAINAPRKLNGDSEISLVLAEKLLPDTQVSIRRLNAAVNIDFSTADEASSAFLIGNQAGMTNALNERLREKVHVRIKAGSPNEKNGLTENLESAPETILHRGIPC